eukprot:m.66476 g.66476  ORF g.66476 m.66476 type:complete len:98 (-) comp18082_c0_seq1:3414-3707(-)
MAARHPCMAAVAYRSPSRTDDVIDTCVSGFSRKWELNDDRFSLDDDDPMLSYPRIRSWLDPGRKVDTATVPDFTTALLLECDNWRSNTPRQKNPRGY